MSYQAVRSPQTTIFYENKAWRIEMREAYQPRLLAQVVLNHGKREKLKMQFGRSFSQDAAEALPPAYSRQGKTAFIRRGR